MTSADDLDRCILDGPEQPLVSDIADSVYVTCGTCGDEHEIDPCEHRDNFDELGHGNWTCPACLEKDGE